MKILDIINDRLEAFINYHRGYTLTKEEIYHLDGIVTVARKTIDKKFTQELYSRACRGDKKCLDILLKNADCKIMDLEQMNLQDTLIVNFKTDLSTANAVQKLNQHVPMDLWNWKTGTLIFMKTWVFMMVFSHELGEGTLQSYDSNFILLKDDKLTD